MNVPDTTRPALLPRRLHSINEYQERELFFFRRFSYNLLNNCVILAATVRVAEESQAAPNAVPV